MLGAGRDGEDIAPLGEVTKLRLSSLSCVLGTAGGRRGPSTKCKKSLGRWGKMGWEKGHSRRDDRLTSRIGLRSNGSHPRARRGQGARCGQGGRPSCKTLA